MLSRRLLRIKVIKTLYAHFKSGSDSLIASEKNLATSLNRTYDLYHQMLWLIVEVMRYAEQRIELGRKKKLPTREDLDPNTKFIDNKLIRQLETSSALGSYLEGKGLGWVKNPELVRNLYESLSASDHFRKYMENPQRSYREDRELVTCFYMDQVEDNQMLEDVLEEQSILWSDDLGFALIMTVRTIESCKAGQEDIPLLPQYKNDDDRDFVSELFRRTLVGYNDFQPYIEKYTENWDLDRIAFMDNLIMAAAIAELMSFPSIPVKVTLDEYIEIAKYYSTPGSSVFINGVLDKIIEALGKEGKIVKSGRGLL